MRRRTELLEIVLGVALIFGGPRACSELYNNQEVITPQMTFHSEPQGITGHLEIAQFRDGTTEIKEYPSLGHRLFDSITYLETNGDCRIDKVRTNDGELFSNQGNIYFPGQEPDLFKDGNELLKELRAKYPAPTGVTYDC